MNVSYFVKWCYHQYFWRFVYRPVKPWLNSDKELIYLSTVS